MQGRTQDLSPRLVTSLASSSRFDIHPRLVVRDPGGVFALRALAIRLFVLLRDVTAWHPSPVTSAACLVDPPLVPRAGWEKGVRCRDVLVWRQRVIRMLGQSTRSPTMLVLTCVPVIPA